MAGNSVIAQRYSQALKKSGLSEYALAKQTNFTGPYLRKWREGKVVNPGFVSVLTLASALDVPPLWLMGMDVPGPILPNRQEEQRIEVQLAAGILEDTIPDVVQVVMVWAALSAPKQALIARIIRASGIEEFGAHTELLEELTPDVVDRARQAYRQRARARISAGRRAYGPKLEDMDKSG